MLTIYAIPFLIISLVLLLGPFIIRALAEGIDDFIWWVQSKFQKSKQVDDDLYDDISFKDLKDWTKQHRLGLTNEKYIE